MYKLLFLIFWILLLFLPVVSLLAQDDGPPPPPPIIRATPPVASVPTAVPLTTPSPVHPVVSTIPVPQVTPVIQELSQPIQIVPQGMITPTPALSSASTEEERLYREGQFPEGPRLRPFNLMREGRAGSWLVGKFVVLDEQDQHHYTIQSHVDAIGLGIVDMATKIGAGRPVIVHLTIVQPPLDGLPHQFQYLWRTPLKVTEINRSSNEVWATDLTRRR